MSPDESTNRKSIGRTPPLPPGAGPFHIKGAGFLGHLAWVDASYPGGRAAFLAALDPAMQAYFDDFFLASSWYDLLVLAAAGRVCAETVGMTYPEFVQMRSRHQASLDIGGMYRLLLKLASPGMIAARLPKIMSQYLDFGTTRIVQDEASELGFEVAGVPLILSEWLLAVYAGFMEVVLDAAGARSPTFRGETAVHANVHGFPAVTLKVDVAWR